MMTDTDEPFYFMPYRHFSTEQQVVCTLELVVLLSNSNMYLKRKYHLTCKTAFYDTLSLFVSVCNDLGISRRQIIKLRRNIIIISLLLECVTII
jgi:hypothetical protein